MTEQQERPGILKVFWPAFFGWGAAATWMLVGKFGALSGAPMWLEIAIGLPIVIGVLGSPLGAVAVTFRYREAQTFLPVALNFSTLLAVPVVTLLP